MINQKQNKLKKRNRINSSDNDCVNINSWEVNAFRYKLFKCFLKGNGLRFAMRYNINENDVQP